MGTFSSGGTIANELLGLQGIVDGLPDNSTGIITPKNFRDGFYTTWENTIFKPTTIGGSSQEYIGIDQLTLSRNDVNWYPKMYFGPKQVNSNDVLNDNLLSNSDVDFFFFTTKGPSASNLDTKISILAGTVSFWENGSLTTPYIESKVVSTVDGNYINFNITNPSFVGDTSSNYYGGDVNIKSDNGYVSINNFNFPKVTNITSGNDGLVLKYRWIAGKAYGFWEDVFSQSISSLYSSGTVSITGESVVISGYKFNDSNAVSADIGGIKAGETFSNVEVIDLLRKIIYTYVAPTLTTTMLLGSSNLNIIESGDINTYQSLQIQYEITRNSTYSISFFDFEVGSPNYIGTLIPANTIPDKQTTTGSLSPNPPSGPYFTGTESYLFQTWTMSLIDTYPIAVTSSTTLQIVLPFYYGTSETSATYSTTVNLILGTGPDELNKLYPELYSPIIGTPSVGNNISKYITTNGIGSGMDGKGFIYFGYPESYPQLVQIKDQNGFEQQIGGIGGDFNTYSITINSPNFYWSNQNYLFYISSASTSVPVSANKWEFIFATSS